MEKRNNKKVSYVCLITASICFYILAIIKFMDENTSTAVIFFCLGSAFLCISSTYYKGENKE